MSNVYQLVPREAWQFSADVVRNPDGTFSAVLTDARATIWDPAVSPEDRLLRLADMLEQSAKGLRVLAQQA